MTEENHPHPVDFIRTEKGLADLDPAGLVLHVIAGTHALSFAVAEPGRNRYVALGSASVPRISGDPDGREAVGLQQAYDRIIRDIPLLPRIRTRIAAIEAGRSTLVPGNLFVPGDETRYLTFNIVPGDNDGVWGDDLRSPEGRNIYAAPVPVRDFAASAFNPEVIVHHSTALIAGVLSLPAAREAGPRIFVNFRDDDIDIMITDRGLLQFFNTFAFREPEDIVYYIMFVMEQYGMEPVSTDIHLSGRIPESGRAYALLARYTRHPSFAGHSGAYQYGHAFDDIPPHLFFTLLHLPLCVS